MERLLFCVCFIGLFFSCTSDDETQSVEPDNFYALKVGNSWEYKYYRYNQNTETYDDTGIVESISVLGKEEIYGIEYFKVKHVITGNDQSISYVDPNGESFEYLRVYDGDLVNSDGQLRFSNNDYEPHLLWEDFWGSAYSELIEGTEEKTVEAGTFTCLKSESYVITSDGERAPGTDEKYYAEGIGLIFKTISFVSSSSPVMKIHLNSYSVE